MSRENGYDPRRSKVKEDTMSNFVNNPVSGDLTEVPGIGPAAAEKLAASEDHITNTFMLIGKYLTMKGPDRAGPDGTVTPVDCREHNDRFWFYLRDIGVAAHRSAICRAIAEKTAQFLPSVYDPRIYEDEEEED